MKDLGSYRYFLCIEIAYNPHGYLLTQEKYAADLISVVILMDDVTVDTPMLLLQKPMPSMGKPLANPSQVYRLVGALAFLTISHHGIAYVVHLLTNLFKFPPFLITL